MDKFLHNEKVQITIRLLAIIAIIYVVARYVIVLIWPVILGYIIAVMLTPAVDLLVNKFKYNKTVATLLVLTLFLLIFAVGGFFLGKMFVSQGNNLIQNWNNMAEQLDEQVKNMCGGIEKGLRISEGKVYSLVEENYQLYMDSGKEKIMSIIMNNSVSAIVKVVEVIAGLIIMVISAFLIMKDKDKLRENFKRFPFHREVVQVGDKLKYVFKAYLKAQLVIMICCMIVCFVGLTILKNPYSLILAVVIGLLDALPFIGVGIVLLPWTAIYFISGLGKNAIVLLITFVLCYILREVLEPRLVGEKIGVSPLASLVVIYAGYKMFGIIGVVFGPLALIVIKECLRSTSIGSSGK